MLNRSHVDERDSQGGPGLKDRGGANMQLRVARAQPTPKQHLLWTVDAVSLDRVHSNWCGRSGRRCKRCARALVVVEVF